MQSRGIKGGFCLLDKLIEKYGAQVGVIALVIAALLWGGEYVVAKDVLDNIAPNWTNIIRDLLTAIMALIIWRKDFKNASAGDWKRGAICGTLFGLGGAFQTMGLELINTGVNAFISAAYVVIIPFIVWIIEKSRPAGKVFISAAIAMIGVTIMSITGITSGEFSMGKGEMLSLLSAFCYAGAIVTADYYTRKTSVALITGMQFIFSFGVALVMALLLGEPVPTVDIISVPIVIEFIYLVIFGTFLTQLLFVFGTKYASASQAGVIFPLESVSATVFGCIFLHEVMQGVQIAGSILILLSIIISSVEFKKND